ncbi:hypothetical protein SAMN04487911_10499 [Arenibacter nanhaiticus]|uniref:IPExxxVDY family protein n=1 Tax=Arenibacter nanhaiticus TaxID=558155 RepID=A0A1M6CYM2_9FLAO|nr:MULTISPECIES: IPExxxVDY family protein [Arenibacter]NKI26535.1 IPExxxVDY family protein [Arenibacter sp. 6A1]SHI65973.1 hypothetical protein SAMN04487911_10499 [Arenibacter nanhaiticus]
MAAIYKISEDFYEDTFTLIALHSSLEDYALVYALNRCLKSNLKRTKFDLEIAKSGYFPIFEWRDQVNDRYYTLISNIGIKEQELVMGDLFQSQPSYSTPVLIPEYREVDYFFKVEHDEPDAEEVIFKSVLSIPRVITAYSLDANKLKSKNNLIF